MSQEQPGGDELDSILPCVCGTERHLDVHYCPKTYIAPIKQLIARSNQRAVREAEISILLQIENMGIGEAKKQGADTVHNMDAYHRAYGEIVSHNVHERLAALQALQDSDAPQQEAAP